MNDENYSPKTWFIDIDGVIFPHNAYLNIKGNEYEIPLPGVVDFFKSLNSEDIVILCTARKEIYRQITEYSLNKAGITYNQLLMNLNTGTRILINDKKRDGKITAYAINLDRDIGLKEKKFFDIL
ncbi:hypothetical protein [Caldiplasma sukawensis]